MPGRRTRVYWDACTFIAWLEQDPVHQAVLDGIADAARAGGIDIVTSNLMIAEVAYLSGERSADLLAPEATALLDAIWQDNTLVSVVDVDSAVVMQARELIRRGKAEKRKLQAADAIHLASAMRYMVAECHTLEGKDRLQRWDGLLGFPVVAPRVPGSRPSAERS